MCSFTCVQQNKGFLSTPHLVASVTGQSHHRPVTVCFLGNYRPLPLPPPPPPVSLRLSNMAWTVGRCGLDACIAPCTLRLPIALSRTVCCLSRTIPKEEIRHKGMAAALQQRHGDTCAEVTAPPPPPPSDDDLDDSHLQSCPFQQAPVAGGQHLCSMYSCDCVTTRGGEPFEHADRRRGLPPLLLMSAALCCDCMLHTDWTEPWTWQTHHSCGPLNPIPLRIHR